MSSEEHPLSKAFQADMTPANLKKAREDVDKQISSNTPKPPPSEEDDVEEAEEEPESGEDEASEEEPESGKDEAEEPESEKDEAEEPEEGGNEGDKPPPSEADEPVEYVADLNNVADVLVILVGKYSRLSKLMYACVVLLAVSVGLIVKAGFEIDHLQASQAGLQGEMRKATKEVADAKQAVKDTGEAVKDTTEAVKEAAEAAPKAVYDADAGTAKIVIPVLKCKGDPKDCENRKRPKKDGISKKPQSYDKSAPPPVQPTPAQKTVPLNPKVELQDDF